MKASAGGLTPPERLGPPADEVRQGAAALGSAGEQQAPRAGRRLDVVHESPHPAYVVWELTLRCDHACRHCGSRALHARPDELTTAEALRVVGELAAMGAREVVLIGGEAYLHDGFLTIVRALAAAGIRPGMTTGGAGIDAALARAMRDAGLAAVSVSVDGLAPAHDLQRARTGSFEGALAALGHLRAAGLRIAANTNVNRLNRADLEALYEVLRDAGVRDWQVQLTAPLGRAADRPDLLLQPWDLLELMPRLAALKERGLREGVVLQPGNNLGYFGPEEALLRSRKAGGTDHFQGCQAGRFVLGIESDGAVKGCPSLQSASYVGGRLRERRLQEIWDHAPELAFKRPSTSKPPAGTAPPARVDALWGFCRTCPFAETCAGGCTFTAHSLFGRPGNNPYCHYRARTLAREGKRERLVPVAAAEGRPFDHALFAIVEEPIDAPDPGAGRAGAALVQIRRVRAAE